MGETEPDASEQSIDDEPTVIIPEGAPKPDERPSDEVVVEGKVPSSVPNSDKNGGYFPVGYLENVEHVAENRHEYDEEGDT